MHNCAAEMFHHACCLRMQGHLWWLFTLPGKALNLTRQLVLFSARLDSGVVFKRHQLELPQLLCACRGLQDGGL